MQDIDLAYRASEAGITLPTNPAALLSLGPEANQLASALPTAPVLSVLLTAAPSGFLSEIVHNPSFASSFESAFAAGSSPSWFNALPTSVKSYLHTYSGYNGIATAAAEIESGNGTSGITTASTGSTTSGSSSMTITSSGGTSGTSATSAGANSVSSSGALPLASSTSTAGAPSQTGVLAAGFVGAMGILGLALAL